MKVKETSLHTTIKSVLEQQGITELYPPQAEALPLALDGKNIIMSIPTASGKSLVAYVAILQRLLQEGGKALYIVPLRALAREKYEDLQQFESLGFKIGLATGDLDESDVRLARYDIIVCTSEKADSLLRHGIKWLSHVKVLVVDEIHLIHDPTRGPTLEVVIARIKALQPSTQIIALSATIRNAIELATWLDAKLVQSDWRPVSLKEGVLYKDEITFGDNSKQIIEQTPGKPVEWLVNDALQQGGQVLVFVNNRRSTVTQAKQLAPLIKKRLTKKQLQNVTTIAEQLEHELSEITSVGKDLAWCLRHGVAFHHAGLASIQRRVIEQKFKERILQCIVATPTLAAGVNIPARRVIIRDLWRYDANFGMQPIPVLEYKQQAGRAGRPQYDSEGEAITIAKRPSQKEKIFYDYILGESEAIYSKLGSLPALRMHLLAAIATKFVDDDESIMQFIESTFFAYQSDVYSYEAEIDQALDFLLNEQFIERNAEKYVTTLFGLRTSSLYIDPLSAVQLRTMLEYQPEKEPHEMSFLHAICATPDIRSFYLKKDDTWVEDKVEHLQCALFIKPPVPSSPEYEWFLSDLKTASVIEDWINEIPEDAIVAKYGIGPGDIHGLVENAEWLLHASREFARMYNFSLVSDISDLLFRVRYGCKKELLNLVELKGIGRVRARSLFKEGFTSIPALRKIPIERLAKIKTIGPAIARNIKQQIGEDSTAGNKELDAFEGAT